MRGETILLKGGRDYKSKGTKKNKTNAYAGGAQLQTKGTGWGKRVTKKLYLRMTLSEFKGGSTVKARFSFASNVENWGGVG